MAPFAQELIQQGLQQGLQQGFTQMTLRLLEKRVGHITLAQKKTITKLPIPKLTQLGEDLLDFQAAEDLKRWLRQNAA